MNAQTMTIDVRTMLTARISCRCTFTADVKVSTLRDAWLIADQHERENARRAYRHDANVSEMMK